MSARRVSERGAMGAEGSMSIVAVRVVRAEGDRVSRGEEGGEVVDESGGGRSSGESGGEDIGSSRSRVDGSSSRSRWWPRLRSKRVLSMIVLRLPRGRETLMS